jgi:hypothetical protein
VEDQLANVKADPFSSICNNKWPIQEPKEIGSAQANKPFSVSHKLDSSSITYLKDKMKNLG